MKNIELENNYIEGAIIIDPEVYDYELSMSLVDITPLIIMSLISIIGLCIINNTFK